MGTSNNAKFLCPPGLLRIFRYVTIKRYRKEAAKNPDGKISTALQQGISALSFLFVINIFLLHGFASLWFGIYYSEYGPDHTYPGEHPSRTSIFRYYIMAARDMVGEHPSKTSIFRYYIMVGIFGRREIW